MEDEDDARSLSVSTSQSQSPSPPPSPPPQPVSEASPATQPPYSQPNGRTMEPVTVAAPPQRTLTLALPIQNPRPVPGGGGSGGGGGREDCWSEGATSALIDAWGERYLELSRGNLKQKQWQEVADAVSSRDDYTKPPKTDVQCKNRIDTLKKKYKLESSKISPAAGAGAGSGSGSATSSWPFFNRLDLLIGPNHKPVAANPPPPPTTNTKASAAARPSFPQRHRTQHPGQQNHKTRSPSPSSSKSGGLSADSADSFPPETANGRKRRAPFPEAEPSAPAAGKVVGLRELARAIARFGEVYQRVESSKLQQAIEMEKQRMGFARELDLQRTQFFMKTQMELSQLNHSGSSRRRRKRGTGAAASAATTSNHNNNNSNSSS